jgi:hypothetical protein
MKIKLIEKAFATDYGCGMSEPAPYFPCVEGTYQPGPSNYSWFAGIFLLSFLLTTLCYIFKKKFNRGSKVFRVLFVLFLSTTILSLFVFIIENIV